MMEQSQPGADCSPTSSRETRFSFNGGALNEEECFIDAMFVMAKFS